MKLKNKSTDKRVFLGTVEIAGYYGLLTKGFHDLGIDASFIQLSEHPFDYFNPSDTGYFKFIRFLSSCSGKITRRLILFKVFLKAVEFLFRIPILLWAIIKFDVFIFGFNSNIVGSYVGYWDIYLLKVLKKQIIYMYHGSDSRAPYLDGSTVYGDYCGTSLDMNQAYQLAVKKKKVIEIIEKYADVVIDSRATAHLRKLSIVDVKFIGIPYSPKTCGISEVESQSLQGDDCVRVLHAPSHRQSKGSDIIKSCIGNLLAQGFSIDYIEIHGMPHAKVIDEILKCDFIIDQLYSDAPMAGFATEAACYGKPAIVCGYLSDASWTDAIPSYYCHPNMLKDAIEKFINEPKFRKNLGHKAEVFVREVWSPKNVAGRFLSIIEGDYPDEWLFDPSATSHLHGWGVSESDLKVYLHTYIEKFGAEALLLEDKPELKEKIIALANLD